MDGNGRSIQVGGSSGRDEHTTSDRNPREMLDAVAAIARCRRGQDIGTRERPADCWYRVVSGAAKRCMQWPDGRQQIVDFMLPGDFLAVSDRDQQNFTFQAVLDGTVVACYPRRRAEALADSHPEVAREIRSMAFRAISRKEEQLLVIGKTTAVKKVGSFLLKMAERLSADADGRVNLPMSRYDIAEYLAISVETVSRALTELKRRRAIRFTATRRLTILDRAALDDGNSDWIEAEIEPRQRQGNDASQCRQFDLPGPQRRHDREANSLS